MGCGSSSATEEHRLREDSIPDDTHYFDHTVNNHDNRRTVENNTEDRVNDRRTDPDGTEDRIRDTTHDPDPQPNRNEGPTRTHDNSRDNARDTRNNERNNRDKDPDDGLKYLTVDSRTQKSKDYHDTMPRLRQSEQWVDQEFPPHVAIQEFSRNRLSWKRTTELCENPVLFSEGTTRYDIGQGSAGTCWFLSMVANLAEKKELLNKVVKEGDFMPSQGVFHCRFWKFGKREDVYIDDFLPVIYNTQIWGAKSSTDKNEMWVSLLEKAFAKLHGSYNSIYGGQASDAYLALTGGIAERIDFEEHEVDPAKLFRRVRNSLYCGAMVTCTVPDKFDKQWGLVGGHAYSLTGAEKVKRSDGQSVSLLRIRNPWGNTEWTGPYSDQSREWENIPPGAVKRVNNDDGEFWISLEHFLTYFSQTTICSLTPDFDMDGCADSMNYVLRIYGQWLGETAAGFKDRLNNPRFVFSVSDEGMTSDGYIPLVIQLIQRTEHRKTDKLSVRCDLFKVLGAEAGRRPTYVLEMLGDETNVYSPSVQCAFRHKVEPGHYVVIPSVINAGEEKEFLIRIFAPADLENCRKIERDAVLMSCDSESSLEINRRTVKLTTHETLFGAWRRGVNAGGQISKRETHHLNPQYTFTVPDREMNATVIFHLMTSQEEERSPIGLRVYPLSQRAPVDIDYLYANYDNCPEPYDGSTFVVTNDLDVKYVLPAGSYLLLVHMDEPDSEKEFALHVRSSCHLNLRGYQTGH